MNASGAVIRQSVGLRLNGYGEKHPFSRKSRGGARAMAARRWSDESHSLYYASSPRCSAFRDVQIKEVKKIADFGTELSREFAALYSMAMGLGLECEEVIGGKLRGEMMKEASELLQAQLNQKKAKEKEMKKKKKEDKATLKSRKTRDCADESSSSSSSESSDSECEEVVERSKPTKNLEELTAKSLDVRTDQSPECKQEEQFTEIKTEEKVELNHSTFKLDRLSSVAVPSCRSSVGVGTKPLDKIEVCMGGKCKKSGSIELLQELEKKIGIEGAVIGCKCMGKCKQGPNVRVLNHSSSLQESELVVKKHVSIGVGLDDVDAIVVDFLGPNDFKMGLLTP